MTPPDPTFWEVLQFLILVWTVAGLVFAGVHYWAKYYGPERDCKEEGRTDAIEL